MVSLNTKQVIQENEIWNKFIILSRLVELHEIWFE